MLDIQPFADFPAAAAAVLKALRQQLGFDLWMVTRTEGDDWIVLQAEDQGYGVREGQTFRWSDSFCSRMVRREGPRIAPEVARVPAYAAAPIGRQVRIGAYVGIPLVAGDGKLFGTLCAIHPTPMPEAVAAELPLIETCARLLSTLLAGDLKAADAARRAEHAHAAATTDDLTGLHNRRGWDRVVAAEEARCRRYGHPACVVAVDLDDLKAVNDADGHAAGDALIRRAARALSAAARAADVVARVGGDEFVILAVETDPDAVVGLVGRLRAALGAADVRASFGVAPREPDRGLKAAWADADAGMYAHKRKRKGSGVGRTPPARAAAGVG